MLVMIKDERSANDPSSFAGLLMCLVVEEAIDSLVLFMAMLGIACSKTCPQSHLNWPFGVLAFLVHLVQLS